MASCRNKYWDPIILNESHDTQHTDFGHSDEKLSDLPTMNSKINKRACYLRYLVMFVGGGVKRDFWSTNVPYPLPERLHVSSIPDTPALMHATSEEYDRIIRLMTIHRHQMKRSKTDHISDMYIMVELILCREVDKISVNPKSTKVGQKLFHLNSQRAKVTQRNSFQGCVTWIRVGWSPFCYT